MARYRLHFVNLVLGLALIAAAGAPPAGAQVLSGEDSAALNALLGAGVLGAAVPTSQIASPTALLPLTPASWNFQFSGGPKQGTTATDTLKPGTSSPWQYAAGTSTIYALATAGDGSIVSPSEQDLGQGVLTQYSPPRPVLVRGMQPGAQQTASLQVSVSDLSNPGSITHTGSLELTLTYLGRYQVTVPAGTYSADLIKWQYNGKVGPASVADVEYRFFAEGVGPVATIDKQSVSAVLVYNKDTKFGRVLVSRGQ